MRRGVALQASVRQQKMVEGPKQFHSCVDGNPSSCFEAERAPCVTEVSKQCAEKLIRKSITIERGHEPASGTTHATL